MKAKTRWWPSLLVLAAILGGSLIIAGGCTSHEAYTEKRRQTLLEMYPPGETTRADVHQRWGHSKWDVSQTRPAPDWTAATNAAVRTRVLNSEQRTSKPVHRVEADLAPDGWSGGLCICWFYYDEKDRIVDVEWQWHTD
jgi:hypothetical protein